MKKIIGTGLSGLVGSRFVEMFKDKYEFVDFSLNTNVNILDQKQLVEAFLQNSDADTVIHLAAFTDTNKAWEERGNKGGFCYRLNVEGTKNIIDLCQKYKKYLIYISTDFVFDGQKDSAYTEDDKPSPIDWYGETKLMGEQLVRNSGHQAVILRIAYPYRANFPDKVDLVRKVIDKLQNDDTLRMFSDQITTPTFIDDIATGLDQFIENKYTGTFHLVGSSSQSPHDMGQLIKKVFKIKKGTVEASSLVEYLKTPGARPYSQNGRLSNEKIKSLGIVPKTLEEGLEAMKDQVLSAVSKE